MKNIKKILFVFLIGVCFCITNVNALVGQIENSNSFIFEYNNQVHVISERNILCDGVNFDGLEIDGYDLEGNFYFEDSENFEIYKITKKNTCEIANNEDLFNKNNKDDRYRLVLEKDNSGNVVINFYENRYDEAFYETLDTEIHNKTYYVFDDENVEMKEYNENEFQSNQKYYEKGYVSLPHNSEKDENLTYYKRYSSYIIDNALIFNVSDEYTSENVNNFYIITDINKPIKSVKVNQEAFKDLDDYDDINIIDMSGNYIIQLTTTGNDSIFKDIEGNVLAKGKNLIIGLLGNDLYMVFDRDKNTSSIYYKDYSTKVIDGEKYDIIADSYFSKYYNLGLAMNLDDANNNIKNIFVEHKIYEIVEGQNQTYTNSNLEFTFSGDLDLFHRILINNVEIEETNYSKISGSTIINLKSEYLDTLEDGTYTLRIEYKDGGYVETTFKVNKNNTLPIFNIILDANGGKFTDSDKYIIDDIINFDYINFNKPTREGYRFIGFFTEKIGGKSFEEVMNSEAGVEENIIFYARWEKNSAGGAGIVEPEENPKTFDGIGTSIFMGTISLIGLAGATIYLRKKNKVRVN